MSYFLADFLWCEEKWQENMFITVDKTGVIEDIRSATDDDKKIAESLNGYFLPGFINTHSHAFQFAQTGFAEALGVRQNSDDFWSWRTSMYQLALSIDPEMMQCIATFLYVQMLSEGITSVVEFHYLHHSKNGNPYSQKTEMSERLMAAAEEVGMRLTLIPIYYKNSNFNKSALAEQRRFVSQNAEQYLELYDDLKKNLQSYPMSDLACGFHSLRAAPIEDIKTIVDQLKDTMTFHIHIAEQLKEVSDCLALKGKRPVKLLAESIELNDRWSLVHATHIDTDEVKIIAQSLAKAVICPTTEGNLGDGFFPLVDFLKHDGRISIGTDSHISISFLENMRLLDYGQRMIEKKRNIFSRRPGSESGEELIKMIGLGGREATAYKGKVGHFKKGSFFDGILIDKDHYHLAAKPTGKILSAFVYGCGRDAIKSIYTSGKKRLEGGKHLNRNSYKQDYVDTLKKLA